MYWFERRGWNRLARYCSLWIARRSGNFVSPKSSVSPSVRFPHPTGIVIGEGVVCEAGVTIFQNVTLGGARSGDQAARNYPVIENNAVVFAGAVVVGRVTIGRDAVIGANSVVLSSIPEGATAVGAPARIVEKKNITGLPS